MKILNWREKINFVFVKLRAENWFLDRTWDSDFCVGIMSMKNYMELGFVVLIWTTMVWYDERRFVIPFMEQRAGGLLRMVTYSVSRYWGDGNWGFHIEKWGWFWWVSYLVSSGGAHCFTVPVLHLSFSTSLGRRTTSVFYISCTPFERIPAQPNTSGIGGNLVPGTRYA